MRLVETSGIYPQPYFRLQNDSSESPENIADIVRHFPISKRGYNFSVRWYSYLSLAELVDESARYMSLIGETTTQVDNAYGEYDMFWRHYGRNFRTRHPLMNRQELAVPFKSSQVEKISDARFIDIKGDISFIGINTPSHVKRSVQLTTIRNASPILMKFIADTSIGNINSEELTRIFRDLDLLSAQR